MKFDCCRRDFYTRFYTFVYKGGKKILESCAYIYVSRYIYYQTFACYHDNTCKSPSIFVTFFQKGEIEFLSHHGYRRQLGESEQWFGRKVQYIESSIQIQSYRKLCGGLYWSGRVVLAHHFEDPTIQYCDSYWFFGFLSAFQS